MSTERSPKMRRSSRNFSSALREAQKIQHEVAGLGFDWPDTGEVLKKIYEEIREVRAALKSKNAGRIREEVGDLLLSVVGLALKSGFDAEGALEAANEKFRRRFSRLERALERQGKSFPQKLEILDALWRHVKD